MIQIGDKKFRNLQEQVAYNATKVEELIKAVNSIKGNVPSKSAGQYLIMAGDSDDELLWGAAGITQVDLSGYTEEEIEHAIDLDKAASTDFTAKDIEILKAIAIGLQKDNCFGTYQNGRIVGSTVTFNMAYISNTLTIDLYINNVHTYELSITNDVVTSYTNSVYPYFSLIPIYGKII